jgi:hypothetical protein
MESHMSMLRAPNDEVGFSQHYADLGLATLDPVVRMIVEAEQRRRAQVSSANIAHYEQKTRDAAELSEAMLLLARLRRNRDTPGHTKGSLAALNRQIAGQESKIESLKRRIKDAKKRALIEVGMHPSRPLAVIAEAGRKPMKLKEVSIPKQYAGKDTLSALASVREEIAAIHEQERGLYTAFLTKEEAMARVIAPIKARAARAKGIPLGEAAHVRQGADGRFLLQSIEIPEAALWEAIVPLAVATFGDRIDSLYERLEFEDGARFMSLKERRKIQRDLKTKLDALELIEGQLIRDATLAGHEVIVRGDMNARALIPLEIDDSVEWEPATKSGFVEVGPGSASYAQQVN